MSTDFAPLPRSTPRAHPWRRPASILAAVVAAGALVVGLAHWKMHALQTGDVAWSTPAIQGEVTVAAGRIYTFDDLDALTVTRLSDGKRLADPPAFEESNMYVGSSGWFATVSFARSRLTFYSPDGEPQWERPLDKGESALQPPHAIGDGFIVYRDCVDDDCALRSVDASGRLQWTTPVPRGAQIRPYAHGENGDQTEATRPGAHLRRVPSVATVSRGGRLFALDDSGRPRGTSIAAKESTVIRDLMVESTRSGSECAYRAVRNGTEAWRTSVPCPGVGGTYTALAMPQRLYVRYFGKDDGDVDTMVSVDLEDGSAHALDFAWHEFDDKTTEAVYVGPDVIVRQKGESVTGIDPDTGKQRWKRTFDKHHRSFGDKSVPSYVGIEVLDGAVSVIGKHAGFWRAAAIGRDLPLRYVRMLDPRTGDTRTQLLQESLYTSVGLGDGQGTLVIADDQLFRLRGK